jgi:uncharacterized paraquat-inducible protein A
MESTRKCPICDKPYKVYAHYAGDQSACPRCRAQAEPAGGKVQPLIPNLGNGCGA